MRGLGEHLAILDTVYKEYPICIFAQTPVALARELVEARGVKAGEIDRVQVTVCEATYTNPGFTNVPPYASALNARVSARFCIAAALLSRPIDEFDYYEAFNDPEVLALGQKIELRLDPSRGDTVDVEVWCGQRKFHAGGSEGETLHPTHEKVVAKVRRIGTPVLGQRIDVLIEAVMTLDAGGDIAALAGCCGQRKTGPGVRPFYRRHRIMMGWRARIGFLVPPGNPTVEPEMMELAPQGVSVHFTRMSASGGGRHACGPGGAQPQPDRQPGRRHSPAGDGLAPGHRHGPHRDQLHAGAGGRGRTGPPAGGAVRHPVHHCLRQRVGGAAQPGHLPGRLCHAVRRRHHAAGQRPPDAARAGRGRVARLENVRNIYEENTERAYAAGRAADRPTAEAVFLSGVGMPTLAALQTLEDDLGKPVISAASAMMWNALRIAGVRAPRPGYGRLLTML